MSVAEEMTTGEIGRRLVELTTAVKSLGEKVDKRPSWDDINRLEAARNKTDGDQDKDIQALQAAQAGAMRLVVTSLVGVLLSLVGALVSLGIALLTR